MARKTESKPVPDKFIEGSQYRVQLQGSITIGRTVLSPAHTQTLEGAFAEANRDMIASAELIEDGDGS